MVYSIHTAVVLSCIFCLSTRSSRSFEHTEWGSNFLFPEEGARKFPLEEKERK